MDHRIDNMALDDDRINATKSEASGAGDAHDRQYSRNCTLEGFASATGGIKLTRKMLGVANYRDVMLSDVAHWLMHRQKMLPLRLRKIKKGQVTINMCVSVYVYAYVV